MVCTKLKAINEVLITAHFASNEKGDILQPERLLHRHFREKYICYRIPKALTVEVKVEIFTQKEKQLYLLLC